MLSKLTTALTTELITAKGGHMPVSDICTNKFYSVQPGHSLQHAAQVMKKHHIGGLIVTESEINTKPIGIITDRDIVISAIAENRSLGTRVDEIMTRNIVKVREKEGIADVIHKMHEEGIRKIVVVDDDGNSCGLVLADDLLQLIASELNDLSGLVHRQLNKEKTALPIARIQ